MTRSARTLALVALLAAATLWVAAVGRQWWAGGVERFDVDESGGTGLLQAPTQPPAVALRFGLGDAARQWARRIIATPDAGSAGEAERLLAASLGERPLYAPTWLDWAELKASSGDLQQAQGAVDLARALWPHRRMLQQRAAWAEVTWDSPERALQALMQYWKDAPEDTVRTLGIARRLAPDEGALLDAAQTIWRTEPDPAVYQSAMMRMAVQATDIRLARGLWNRLDAMSKANEAILYPYLQLLVEQGLPWEADAEWQRILGDPPGLANGGIEQPMQPLGPDFRPGWGTPGWRYGPTGVGYRIRADSHHQFQGKNSLRLTFAGTENVNLAEPSQIVRVRPGRSYRLRGHWSADGITTRAGVFLEMYTLDQKPAVVARTEPRWGSWDWEPFELAIDVPNEVVRLVVRVRRNKTNALDNRLSGSLWLDELVLEPIQP
jgi:tetratricopeptide (TPR) repeat protein